MEVVFLKKIIISTFCIGIAVFLSPLDHSLAKKVTEEPKIISDQDATSIDLEWGMEGEKYEIYRNNEMIWEGSGTEYVDEGLENGSVYSYNIIAYDKDDNILDISNLDTLTDKNTLLKSQQLKNKVSSDSLVNSKITINSGINYVNLSWENFKDDDGLYEIYRNSELIAETGDNHFYDSNVNSDTIYTYEVVATNNVSIELRTKINKEISKENLKFSDQELNELYQENSSLIAVVETNKKNLTEELKSIKVLSSTKNSSSDFTNHELYDISYTTFIPGDFEKAPNFINGYPFFLWFLGDDLWFKGDDRKFDDIYKGFNNKTSYRTRTITTVGWDYRGLPVLSAINSAGESHAYIDKDDIEPFASDTADADSDIETWDSYMSTSQIMWNVDHNSGMPFDTLYPNITYSYRGHLTDQGIFIDGNHDHAPNHEMYIRINRGQNRVEPVTVFQHEGGTLFNLIPGISEFSKDYYYVMISNSVDGGIIHQ